MKEQLLISPKVNQNNFDILRFILASSVILCHCYVIYYGYDLFVQREPFMKWSQGQISIGSVAVNFFFAISGFLIVKSFETSTSLWDYFKKRVLRIYPGFIVAFLISIMIFAPIGNADQFNINGYWDFFQKVHLKRELANMFTLQAPVEHRYFTHLPQKGLNNSLWTIQYEFICYLLVPLLAAFSILKSRRLLLAALILTYGLHILQSLGYIFPFSNALNGGVIANPFHYPRFFTYFLIGACIYFYRDHLIRSHLLALVSFLLIVFSFAGYKSVDQIFPITGSYLLFYLAYHPRLQYPAFSKRGDFSYGIYLYGWPIQQLIMMFFWEKLTPISFFLFVFPIVLFFAYLSWNFIEGPALRLNKRKIQATITKQEAVV